MHEFRFGFIACGNMQSILIRALLNGENAPDVSRICIYEPNDENIQPFLDLGIRRVRDYDDLIERSDIIFIGVKPQILPKVISSVDADAIGPDKVFVSIVAGVTASYLEHALGDRCSVIRVMPNTPMLLGKGAIAIGSAPRVPSDIFDLVCDLFASCGLCRVVDESLLNVSTALNGSGPAYFYRICAEMAKFGEEQGMSFEDALALSIQTMAGAAEMLRSSGKSPEELCRMVMSPGGTTVAAMDAFTASGLDEALCDGMRACLRRAKELAV